MKLFFEWPTRVESTASVYLEPSVSTQHKFESEIFLKIVLEPFLETVRSSWPALWKNRAVNEQAPRRCQETDRHGACFIPKLWNFERFELLALLGRVELLISHPAHQLVER
jgi:hypothetical protein